MRPYLVIVCGGCGDDLTVEALDGDESQPLQIVAHPCHKCIEQAIIEWRLRVK